MSLPIFRLVVCSLTIIATGCTSGGGEPASPALAPANPPIAIAETPAPRRTVEVRNPFGNTKAAQNLMADGDFELTGRYDQQPWLAFGESGQAVLNFETGGRCRSGIRCLVLTPGEIAIGWMATPRVGRVTVSLWAKPEGGTCADLTVQIVDMDEGSNTAAATLAAPAADDAGACLFEGTVPGLPGGAPAVWLEIDARSKATRVLADDVVAMPAEGASTRAYQPTRPTKASARLPAIAEWLKRHRRFGLPQSTGPDTPPPSRAATLRAR